MKDNGIDEKLTARSKEIYRKITFFKNLEASSRSYGPWKLYRNNEC